MRVSPLSQPEDSSNEEDELEDPVHEVPRNMANNDGQAFKVRSYPV